VRPDRKRWWLLIPAGVVFTALLLLPMGSILNEGFKLFVPGRIGSTAGAPYTLVNYLELVRPSYFN
jgi:putative spermidine/putrescine transport system permease protein